MGEKRIGAAGFADAFMAPGAGANRRLERIAELIDWSGFESLLSDVRSPKGRPGYPALSLFKALLLQQWYGLSDPGLEEALGDRLSFRRFCGFSLSDDVPDETVFVRFRGALAERELSEVLLSELSHQLEAKRLIVKTGTLVDASLVEASVARPTTRTSETDPDARWTKRGAKRHFGYKMHIGVDQGSGLIRRAELTPAQVNDTVPADRMICGDERAVYADRAYDAAARRARLRAAGVKDRIMHRPNKHHKQLPPWKTVRNRGIARIRSAVEGVFGTFKRSYGYRRVRYRGLQRNHSHFLLLCLAYNLRRAERITS